MSYEVPVDARQIPGRGLTTCSCTRNYFHQVLYIPLFFLLFLIIEELLRGGEPVSEYVKDHLSLGQLAAGAMNFILVETRQIPVEVLLHHVHVYGHIILEYCVHPALDILCFLPTVLIYKASRSVDIYIACVGIAICFC
jgi:hypothetical protein